MLVRAFFILQRNKGKLFNFSLFIFMLNVKCLGTNTSESCVCGVGSAFIILCWVQVCSMKYEYGGMYKCRGLCWVSMDVQVASGRCTSEQGWLWPHCQLGLDLGDRHPSYWQKTVKKSFRLIVTICQNNWNYHNIELLHKEKYIKTLSIKENTWN